MPERQSSGVPPTASGPSPAGLCRLLVGWVVEGPSCAHEAGQLDRSIRAVDRTESPSGAGSDRHPADAPGRLCLRDIGGADPPASRQRSGTVAAPSGTNKVLGRVTGVSGPFRRGCVERTGQGYIRKAQPECAATLRSVAPEAHVRVRRRDTCLVRWAGIVRCVESYSRSAAGGTSRERREGRSARRRC